MERKAPTCYMNNEEKIKIALSMVDEMLQIASKADEEHIRRSISEGQGEKAVGESWQVFYLKNLKDLLGS